MGAGHHGYACRIENTAELTALAEAIEIDTGGADILANCAGFTCAIPHADLDALDDETFDRILSVNTRAAFSAIRAFAPQLRARGDGLVVQLSSIAATTAVGSCIAYCAAKAGMDVMGMALARVLAPDIRVLSVSPGVVDTDFVPGRDREARAKTAATTPLKRLCNAAGRCCSGTRLRHHAAVLHRQRHPGRRRKAPLMSNHKPQSKW